jgi:small nuclear ribonucleoprotein
LLNVREDVVMEIDDVAVEELEHDKGKAIFLKLKDGRTIRGKLEDVDKRMNVTLSSAEEISTDNKAQPLGVLLVRGDSVIIISPS